MRVKKNGHGHLAAYDGISLLRKVFASGEAYCYFDNNKIKIRKLTNIAGTFRDSSEEHAQRIQSVFRKKFGSLKDVIYVNQNSDKTKEITILTE